MIAEKRDENPELFTNKKKVNKASQNHFRELSPQLKSLASVDGHISPHNAEFCAHRPCVRRAATDRAIGVHLLGWHVCRTKFARNSFFELRNFSRKTLRNFPQMLSLYFVGLKKSCKIPSKFPTESPSQTSKKYQCGIAEWVARADRVRCRLAIGDWRFCPSKQCTLHSENIACTKTYRELTFRGMA